MIKWILAILGYSYLRFPGALLGFFVGGAIERLYNPSSSWIKVRTQNLNPEIFQLNLLALAATIIKADGIVKKQELQFVRNFFISNYGPQKASTIFEKRMPSPVKFITPTIMPIAATATIIRAHCSPPLANAPINICGFLRTTGLMNPTIAPAMVAHKPADAGERPVTKTAIMTSTGIKNIKDLIQSSLIKTSRSSFGIEVMPCRAASTQRQ